MTQEELLVLRKQPALAAGELSERIVAEKQGPVGWLTFNNPARRNAISIDMWEAIPKVLALQHDRTDLGILLEAVENLRDRLPHVDEVLQRRGAIAQAEL